MHRHSAYIYNTSPLKKKNTQVLTFLKAYLSKYKRNIYTMYNLY